MKIKLKMIMTVACLFLSFSAFAMNDWNIVQDGDGHGQGFIEPNELGYLNFAPYLKDQQGVLISVGTFRAFQAAVLGEFSKVILLDYAGEVVQFNKMFLQIVKKSKDRSHFFDLLFGGERVLSKIENKNESLLKSELGLTEKTSLKSFLRKIIILYNDQSTSGANFLTSDYYFMKLKSMVIHNQFILLNGSLSGRESLAELAEIMKKKDLKVSVLDLSNAKDYIIQNKELHLYYRNLKRLPWAENAQVLWSMPAHIDFFVSQNIQNKWAYLANPASDYIHFIERLQDRPARDVVHVYLDLHPEFVKHALPKIHSCSGLLLQ